MTRAAINSYLYQQLVCTKNCQNSGKWSLWLPNLTWSEYKVLKILAFQYWSINILWILKYPVLCGIFYVFSVSVCGLSGYYSHSPKLSMGLCLCVSLVPNWWPVQGVPCLLPYGSWDMLQAPLTQFFVLNAKRCWKYSSEMSLKLPAIHLWFLPSTRHLTQRTAAHWMFYLFWIILFKHLRWLCGKISIDQQFL